MADVIRSLERFHQQVLRQRSDPLLGYATLSIGGIRGGTSVNTVPDRCEIEVDRRLLPGEDPLKSIAEVRAWLNNNGQLDFEPIFGDPWVIGPALQRARDETVIRQLAASCDTVLGSHKTTGVVYGTDAPFLAGTGIPTVVFGAGSIHQAHSKDEWVSIDEVEKATEVFYDFLCRAGATV
jgi:acetylornithine deacetylase